jgi:hypothetical protein
VARAKKGQAFNQALQPVPKELTHSQYRAYEHVRENHRRAHIVVA